MMALLNTRQSFGSVSKGFHWTIALLVITQFVIIFLKNVVVTNATASQLMTRVHKPLGVILLVILPIAISWRLISVRPSFSEKLSEFEKRLARLAHWLLHISALVMAGSGLLMSITGGYPVNVFGYQVPFFLEKNKSLSHFFHETHESIAYCLLGLIVLHLLATLKHHWVYKDNTLKRMLPFT